MSIPFSRPARVPISPRTRGRGYVFFGIFLLALLSLTATCEDEIGEFHDTQSSKTKTVTVTEQNLEDFGTQAGSEQEIVPTQDYLEFSSLDPVPPDLIEWHPNSSRFLYLAQDQLPYVYFMGKVPPNTELMFNEHWIPMQGGVFSIKVPLRLKPSVFLFRVLKPNGTFVMFRFINYWLKLPTSLSFKVQSSDGVVEVGKSFYSRFEHSAFVQLYSGDSPSSVVDLDSQGYAKLSFRVYAPPKKEQVYDGWQLVIRDERKKPVLVLKRFGFPPPMIDWRELGIELFAAGRYQYQLNLSAGGKVYEGANNQFQAIEGHSILKHKYLPGFGFEPRAELGYFSFNNGAGLAYNNQYLAADLGLVLFQRFLIRAAALSSIHTIDPTSVLASGRMGLGMRLYGEGHGWIGRPYHYRMDVLCNFSTYTISPESPIRRFTAASILVEPQFILWSVHYLNPFIETALSLELNSIRISAGLTYEFFIRPWSVKFGIGAALDDLVWYKPRPDLTWTVFRSFASFTFFL